jgi:hypothetical protein
MAKLVKRKLITLKHYRKKISTALEIFSNNCSNWHTFLPCIWPKNNLNWEKLPKLFKEWSVKIQKIFLKFRLLLKFSIEIRVNTIQLKLLKVLFLHLLVTNALHLQLLRHAVLLLHLTAQKMYKVLPDKLKRAFHHRKKTNLKIKV